MSQLTDEVVAVREELARAKEEEVTLVMALTEAKTSMVSSW